MAYDLRPVGEFDICYVKKIGTCVKCKKKNWKYLKRCNLNEFAQLQRLIVNIDNAYREPAIVKVIYCQIALDTTCGEVLN